MAIHAKRNASGSAKWISCAGSIRMCEGIPSRVNEAAELGTAVHMLIEMCMTAGNDAADHKGSTICTEDGSLFVVDDKMAEGAQVMLDYVRSLAQGGAKLLVEHKFDLSWLYPEMFGTCDCVVIDTTNKVLHVIDYKNGYNVVNARWNSQLLYYGLGAAHGLTEEQVETVQLTIVQPNAYKEEAIESWSLPLCELRSWGVEVLLPAAKRTEDEDAPLHAGSWCRWCDAKNICPAPRAHLAAVAQTQFMAPTPPTVESLTPDQLVKVIDSLDLLTAWAKEAKAYAQELAEMGTKIPGYKLVRKGSNRRWLDEQTVVDTLSQYLSEDQIYRKQLNTLGGIEKALKVRDVDLGQVMPLVTEKPDAGLELVSADDKRKEELPTETMMSLDYADVFK